MLINHSAHKNLSLRIAAACAVVLTVFFSYNFINAAWTNPPANPPISNVDAPLNTGSDEQTKIGNIVIKNSGPALILEDTTGDNNRWFVHSNNSSGSGPSSIIFYDRNGSGAWDSPDGNPSLIVTASGTVADGTSDQVQTPGVLSANSVYAGNGIVAGKIAIGNCIYGDAHCSPLGATWDWDYESIQMPANNNLRVWFGNSERFLFASSGTLTLQGASQVQADKYCDKYGGNCFAADDVVQSNFGGMYSKVSGGGCKMKNPVTDDCTCPTGYRDVPLANALSGSEQYLNYCMNTPGICDVTITGSLGTPNTIHVTRLKGSTIHIAASVWTPSEHLQNLFFTGGALADYEHSLSRFNSAGHSTQVGWWSTKDYDAHPDIISWMQTSDFVTQIKSLTIGVGNSASAAVISPESPGETATVSATVTHCDS